MTSCIAGYNFYEIKPPTEMLFESLWIFIAVVIVLLFIVTRIKSVREKLKSKNELFFSILDKISLALFGLLVAYFALFVISFIMAFGVTCFSPGILTDSVLYNEIESQAKDGIALEGVNLMPDGYFESSKYTFSCVSNSKIALLPDSSLPVNIKRDFPPELECKDFVKGNKIVNNTKEQYFLFLYQCKPSNKINVLVSPSSSGTLYGLNYVSLKNPEILCDYLLN